jgi:hypothetical protein
MKTKTIAILGAAAAVAVGLAAIVARSGTSAEESTRGEVMFQSLTPRINDVALVEIKRTDAQFSIRREGESWGIAEKGGYPVKFERVKETVVSLSQLRALEPMTSRADRYPQIGVQDPEKAGEAATGGGPTLLTLKDDKGAVLASAIVGNPRFGAQPGVYIRKPGEEQSWLAQGRLEIPGHFTQWIEPQIMSIQRDRVKSVDVAPVEGDPFSIERATPEQTNYTVVGLPPGQELKSTTAADAFGSALAFLSLEDVARASAIDLSPASGAVPGPLLQFRTFDGLLVMVQLTDKDGASWARIAASPAPEEPNPGPGIIDEAAQINSRVDGWIFALPAYKSSVMKTTMLDLIRDGRPFELPPSMQGEGIEIISMDPPANAPPLPFGNPPPQSPEAPEAPPAAPAPEHPPTTEPGPASSENP